jgi:hypothetical protein
MAFPSKMILVIVFSLAILSLFYGNIIYQLTRVGQINRQMRHKDDEADLEDLHWPEHRRRRRLARARGCARAVHIGDDDPRLRWHWLHGRDVKTSIAGCV